MLCDTEEYKEGGEYNNHRLSHIIISKKINLANS